jgi:hypothetical protein
MKLRCAMGRTREAAAAPFGLVADRRLRDIFLLVFSREWEA